MRRLEKREFFLVYLPTVSLHDGRCVGAEALIRWRRPGNVVVDPEHFIPLTDQTPLSGAITYWVIDTVADEIGDWLGANEDAHISINVPPEILGRGGLDYAATKSGLRAHVKQVILEITERGVPDQLGLDALNSIARPVRAWRSTIPRSPAPIWRCSPVANSTSSRSTGRW